MIGFKEDFNANNKKFRFMSEFKVHVLHTGKVRVSPYLPFGGKCSILKASGIIVPKKEWIWIPVSVYLIEHPKGLILVDTGWGREMSPNGVYDSKAQIKSFGCYFLYLTNQGVVEKGQTIAEQLAAMGHKTSDIDYLILTHLDCDHAQGLKDMKDAKRIMVSRAEMEFATHGPLENRIRYHSKWWKDVDLELFDWNDREGYFNRSFDLFGDKSIQLINIPGHCDGLVAVKISNKDNKFVLLFSDGGYAAKSWKEMIVSGIAVNREQQYNSLKWIREQSMMPECIESIATHDADVLPHVIEF